MMRLIKFVFEVLWTVVVLALLVYVLVVFT